MTKLIAVHYLQLGSGVKGVVDEIAPGKAFMARDDEMFLVERGAARKPRADEKDMPVVSRAVSADGHAQVVDLTTDGDTDEDSSAPVESDLADMTKAQLIEFAKVEEIEIDEKANKPVILEVIQAALAARSGDGLI